MKNIFWKRSLSIGSANILQVIGGNLGVQLASFTVSVLLARTLTKDSFGQFIVCLTVMETLRFISQFGLRMTIIKFASQEESMGRPLAPVFTAFLALKLAISIVISIIIFIAAQYICINWLKDPALAPLIKIVSCGLVGTTLFDAVLIHQNVTEDFAASARWNIILGVIRVTLVAISLVVFGYKLAYCLSAWVLSPLFPCIWHWKFFKLLASQRGQWTPWLGTLVSFGKWIFLGTVFTMACNRLDFYWLNWQEVKSAVADYGVAMNLAMAVKLFSGAAGTVLMPKACKRVVKNDYQQSFVEVAKVSVAGAAIVICIAVIGSPAIKLIYGNNFSSAFLPTVFLAIGYWFFMIQDLLAQIFVAAGFARLKALHVAFQFMMLVLVGRWLIPSYLAVGSAGSVLVMYLCGALTAILFLYMYFFPANLKGTTFKKSVRLSAKTEI